MNPLAQIGPSKRYIQLDITFAFRLELRCASEVSVRVMDDGHEVIHAEKLTTFEISSDGSRFCMHVADEGGSPRGLSLPAECLIPLIMTLPEIASRALKAKFSDDSLRIVYPLGSMKVEATHVNEITILTLSTEDGFSVSFGFTADDLKRLEATARDARTKPRPVFTKN
jgi:hypothetical protein